MLLLNVHIYFILIVFSSLVFGDETDHEAPTYVFGDIFKSIPTLFEYLLQMVDQRPEVLETNDIALMKREIGIDNCEECDRVKRELIRNLKSTTNKVADEFLQVTDKTYDNVDIYKEVSSQYETEYVNLKREIPLQPDSITGPVPCNLKMRELRICLDDNTKRKSNNKICSRTFYNAEQKKIVNIINNEKAFETIRQSYKAMNKKKISNTEEINYDNINKKRTNMNKNNVHNRRHSRHKKLASDPNTSRSFSLTPEEVEEHIFKVDQLLEEHKRNRTK